MKIRYLKLKNWLLASIMGLFGLSACHSQKNAAKGQVIDKEKVTPIEEHRMVPMYGVPVRDRVRVADVPDTNGPKVVPQPREPQVTVYGVPTVDFTVSGRVVNAKGKPVKGMQVIMINDNIDPDNLPNNDYWQERLKAISDTTDQDGRFVVKDTGRPWDKVRVLVRDIDGAANGSYANQVADVELGEPKPKSNQPVSSWNLGEKKGEVTVKVDKK